MISNSWYVPAWMHIFQPHIVLWRWVIFPNFSGKSNKISESLIKKIPFSSYGIENPVASFLAYIYVVHGHILGEALSDVAQSSLLYVYRQA